MADDMGRTLRLERESRKRLELQTVCRAFVSRGLGHRAARKSARLCHNGALMRGRFLSTYDKGAHEKPGADRVSAPGVNGSFSTGCELAPVSKSEGRWGRGE